MSYLLLKSIHILCAGASYALFVLRGIWRLRGPPLFAQRWTRIVPHVNDTLLLAAAIGMAIALAPYPASHAFLATKVTGLLIYVSLGMVAFRWATTMRARVIAWLAAQIAFFHIVGVSITKSALLGLG